jgi:hypothetical protein
MNVIPADGLSGAIASADASAKIPRHRVRAALGVWPQLAILTAFWAYVTLSNVLYARSMSASLDPRGTEHFFAPWTARSLQHLLLYPVLIGCIRLSQRVGWRPAWRAPPLQLVLALAFAALGTPLLGVAEWLVGDHDAMKHAAVSPGMMGLISKAPSWVASATSFLLTYGFALALVTGFSLYQRIRDSELRSAALERAWSRARLAALRMQLSPHTLFNLLHTIRGQIAWNPATAQSMIVQLGDLLRRLLDAGGHEFSPLPKELEFAQLYLELQQRRFSDRLTIRLPDIAQLPRAWVPSLILQPLIENAVVHGLAGHDGAVQIKVEVAAPDDLLVLRVVNTTAPESIAAPHGIGLRNVGERLSVHFGDRASLVSGSLDAQHWIAEARMPLLRELPQAGAPGD